MSHHLDSPIARKDGSISRICMFSAVKQVRRL